MKLSQIIVKELSGALRDLGTRYDGEDSAEIYLLEDTSAVFGPDAQGKTIFQGLSFEMVGRDFHVLPNLELVISETVGEDGSSETELYTVEDKRLAERVGEYMLWRARLLRDLEI